MDNAYPPPISVQLTDTLITRIRDDYYSVDEHFPSESELCKEFKVSRATVRTVLAALVAKGLLIKRAGVGSFLVPGAKSKIGTSPKIDIKIALVMSGIMTDGGWNTEAYRGLDKLKAEGFQTGFSEMVPPKDIGTALKKYADDGYDLVIGHGWGFREIFVEQAPKYPDLNIFVTADWMHENIPDNLQFFHPPFRYSGYLAGALASLVSKSHVIGVVGGANNQAQRNFGQAFQQAAQETVPGTNALVDITGDYNDVRKGRLAATSLVESGADVIWHSADLTGLGVISAAIEGGAYVIGCYSDQTSMAYSSFLTSITWDLGYVIYNRAQAVRDGSFEGGFNWEPPFSDIVYFSAGGREMPYVNSNVSPEVQKKMESILEDLKNGSILVNPDIG